MKLLLQLYDDIADQVAGEDTLHLPNDLAAALAAGGRAAWPPAAPGWIGHLAPPAGVARFHIRWRVERCACLSCQAPAAPPDVPRRMRGSRR